ncbi:MAG TPA: DNA methyltransferase [bacterium]|nr:methyltransferase domain-containing protein [Candidatus Omnitrophota bacterium]HOL93174.1 DNA methyltransferase [bacterium]HPP00211.1 DNA methyltransferase [bacterium]HXK92977.1 DNA methyltransferase [bacterium]
MPTYLFQLGHCPDLSYAELSATSQRMPEYLNGLRRTGGLAFGDCPSSEAVRAVCAELGGTIRACELLATGKGLKTSLLEPEILIEKLAEIQAADWLLERSKRPVFGLSILGKSEETGSDRYMHTVLHITASWLKEQLREKGVSSRFVLPGPERHTVCLSGAQVEKNRMLEEGAEFCFHVAPEQGLWTGRTVWLQDYEAYSQLDYGRPNRDTRSGLLPPKLARMLINLARTPETATVLDPFCGSGGILTEAALLGLSATGFDSSSKAIEDAIRNWQWFQKQQPTLTGKVQIREGDARVLHTLCEPLYFDACVTEPYLGPPLKRPLSQGQFEKLAGQLIPLYLRALGEIRTVVKPGGRVVFIAPRFRLSGEENSATLPLFSEIKLQGYTVLDPLAGFTPVTGRKTLIYSRPKQFVQREIFVLEA